MYRRSMPCAIRPLKTVCFAFFVYVQRIVVPGNLRILNDIGFSDGSDINVGHADFEIIDIITVQFIHRATTAAGVADP